MKVYAQPTEWNERLCSLMSAVLQRSIHPSFTHAIRDKSQRMLSGGNTTTTHNSNNKSTVKILFVGRPLQTISSMTQAFGGLRYVLDVVSVVSSDNEQEIQWVIKTDNSHNYVAYNRKEHTTMGNSLLLLLGVNPLFTYIQKIAGIVSLQRA